MVELLFSPEWFYGKDIAMDVIAIIVPLLIAFFFYKYYCMDKMKKCNFWVSMAFFVISLGFLFKILTNFTLYYVVDKTVQVGLLQITYQTLNQATMLPVIGQFVYRLLTLLGLYALYSIYVKETKLTMHMLVIYLIVLCTIFSNESYFVFHLTSLLLFSLIAVNYVMQYKNNKNKNTLYLALSFAVLALSQICFIFHPYTPWAYVVSETFQLIGYVILLLTFILVLKHGKKKRKA